MSAGPLSIQIVTWQSAAVIDACLASLAAQTSRAFEVIVVDNASTDESADRVESWRPHLPALTVVREAVNQGFCGGQNRALARATGDWILFLNPDVELPPQFVADALRVCERVPPGVGAVAPCIFLPDGRLDSTGLAMDRFRRAYDRDRGAPAARRMLASRSVLGCTGAAALLRRAMLDDIAIDGVALDEALFAYYDDLDVAWRATLGGWTCQYEPALLAVHRRGARNSVRGVAGRPTRTYDQVLSVRNRLLVMARCDRRRDVAGALLWLVPFELARVGYLAVRSPRVLIAYVEALRHIGSVLRARARIHGRGGSLPPLPWRVH